MIYLDSSALLKLLREEPESAPLEGWLEERRPTPMVTSALAEIEVRRACRRIDPAALPDALRLLASLDLVPISEEIIQEAAVIGNAMLRSLDAIHLASAMALGDDLMGFVAYDRRLGQAADEAGLPMTRPAGGGPT